MNSVLGKFLKYTGTFLCGVLVLTLLLVAVACIPRSAIQKNMEKSAHYLCDGELFGKVIDDVDSSKIDRYADSILLAIAYQYDSEKPLESVMRSAYYSNPIENENQNLLDAVTKGKEANLQYLRYWHGSLALVRPLLVLFDISHIYVINAVLCAILVVVLLVMLLKSKLSRAAVAIAVGLMGSSVWFVPFSLEYTWTYLLMLAASIVAVLLARRRKWNLLGIFFMVVGMVTSYLDFLTTETLTLTVPLLLVLWLLYSVDDREAKGRAGKISVQSILFWGFGYVGMWVSKWLLASVVLSENVMPYVTQHMNERIGGDVGISFGSYLFGAVFNNMKCLFPFDYGEIGVFAGILLLLYLVYRGFVYHRNNTERKLIYSCIGIAVIPYVRYLILHNHSYLHFFFTYRAQMGTIVAILFVLEIVTDGRWLPDGRHRRGKT